MGVGTLVRARIRRLDAGVFSCEWGVRFDRLWNGSGQIFQKALAASVAYWIASYVTRPRAAGLRRDSRAHLAGRRDRQRG